LPYTEILGLVAGLLTTVSILPQVIRVYRLRSAYEISLMYNVLFLIGGILWLIYGVYDRLFPVMLWNALATVLVATLLIAKLKYGHKKIETKAQGLN
jgi:MtN3 and saliva related transmembrane protein